MYRYNFRPNLSGHEHVKRVYALGDESGLLTCTWPHDGRPRHPFAYCDEVWTGIEYQVAAHLIYEGLVEEGLTLVRAVRARHDGYRRNAWNEVECGNHYARSMASWAVLLALSGFRYDAPKSAIGFAPATDGDEFRCFFSTGSGWGTFTQDRQAAELRLEQGSLRLAHINLTISPSLATGVITINDDPVTGDTSTDGPKVTITFKPVTMIAGDVLRIGCASA